MKTAKHFALLTLLFITCSCDVFIASFASSLAAGLVAKEDQIEEEASSYEGSRPIVR